jgi:hypothetical protein
MTIKFKCPHCQKPLAVKEELAGKRAACPACKKPITIPAPVAAPADVEAFAAAALADAAAAKEEPAGKPIKFTCNWCDEAVEVPFEDAGKQTPCPACKRIVKVPLPQQDKPKDWRELVKKGPAAALINQPEQLDGAWGTEVKGRVSRTALEEAEALPEVEVEPVGVGTWIKRGLISAAVLGGVTLLFVTASRQTAVKGEKAALTAAIDFDKARAKDAKTRLHPVLTAAIYQAAGEFKLREDKPEDARQEFLKARVTASTKEPAIDNDLFLANLAVLQLRLSGDELEVRAKTRFEWRVAQNEIDDTLAKINSDDAKVIVVRELAGVLVPQKQPGLAITLASSLMSASQLDKVKSAPVLPQQTGLMFAHADLKKGKLQLDPPDLKKGPPADPRVRTAYAEGNAWKGDIGEAKKLIDAAGTELHRLDAALGVAAVLLADKNNAEGPKQAAPFVDEAIKLYSKVFAAAQPSWHGVHLVRVASRTDHADKVTDLIKRLPGPFKRRAQYDWLLAQLDKAGATAPKDLGKDLPDKEGPNRGLACIAIGRYCGQFGHPLPALEEDDQDYRVFLDLGHALGQQERRQK